MGLPLFVEPKQTPSLQVSCLTKPENVEDCGCCLDAMCTQSRDHQFCRHLVVATWVMRWYDPWISLQETISASLGHERFTYWGVWLPSGVDRSGTFKLIVRAHYPWVSFSDQDITSLSAPWHPDSLFCLERCSALRASCCLIHLQGPLFEIELALVQPRAFRMGDEALHVFLKTKFLDLGTL